MTQFSPHCLRSHIQHESRLFASLSQAHAEVLVFLFVLPSLSSALGWTLGRDFARRECPGSRPDWLRALVCVRPEDAGGLVGHVEELFWGAVGLPNTVSRRWRRGSSYLSRVTHKLSSVLWLGAGWVVLSQWAALLGKAPPPPASQQVSFAPQQAQASLVGCVAECVCNLCVSPAPVIAFRCAVEFGVC